MLYLLATTIGDINGPYGILHFHMWLSLVQPNKLGGQGKVNLN